MPTFGNINSRLFRRLMLTTALVYIVTLTNTSRYVRELTDEIGLTKNDWGSTYTEASSAIIKEVELSREDPTSHNFNTVMELVDKLKENAPVPRDLNIVMMGDSMTRYQYIDLVSFLFQGEWNNIWKGKVYSSWTEYFTNTSEILKDFEQCDCADYVDDLHDDPRNVLHENRYFHDKERNNTVRFLQKFGGHSPFHSNWHVSTVHESHEEDSDQSQVFEGNWLETITDFVCHLTPKPSFFIFNTGLWNSAYLDNEEYQEKVVRALKECGIKSVYKTTTLKKAKTNAIGLHEKQLCEKTDACFDLGWTHHFTEEYYADKCHFKPEVWVMLNFKLLSLLSSFDTDENNDFLTKKVE